MLPDRTGDYFLAFIAALTLARKRRSPGVSLLMRVGSLRISAMSLWPSAGVRSALGSWRAKSPKNPPLDACCWEPESPPEQPESAAAAVTATPQANMLNRLSFMPGMVHPFA